MTPTQHSSNNKVFGAPANWDQSGVRCSALAVTTGEVEGCPVVASFWRPSAQELADLNAGGLVMLTVFSSTIFPVSVDVETSR